MIIIVNDKSVSSWLDKLQQESWNLELLITGFSIFLLLQIGGPLKQLSSRFFELSNFSWEAAIFAIFLSILVTVSNVMLTLIQTATIPSRVIKTRHLPLIIRYYPKNNAAIAELCTDYTPSKTQAFISGIQIDLGGNIYVGSPTVEEESPEKLLNCLSQFYQIYLDSIPLKGATVLF